MKVRLDYCVAMPMFRLKRWPDMHTEVQDSFLLNPVVQS
jgi:hypothetical protein